MSNFLGDLKDIDSFCLNGVDAVYGHSRPKLQASDSGGQRR